MFVEQARRQRNDALFGGLLGEELAAKLVGASEHKRGDGGEEEGA